MTPWRPEAPATRTPRDIYATERNIADAFERGLLRGFLIGLKARRAWVLGVGYAGDAAKRIGRRPA